MAEQGKKPSLVDPSEPEEAVVEDELKVEDGDQSDSDSDAEGDSGIESEDEKEEAASTLPQALVLGNKRQSFGLRAKKFVASKTAQTKLGRKAIGHFLGESGTRFVSTMKAAATLHAGKKKGKHLKMVVFKMALKGKLLQDERLIRKKDVWMMREPCNNMAIKFYECVRPRDREADQQAGKEEEKAEDRELGSKEVSPREVDIEPLLAEVEKVKQMSVNLVQNHITEKNLRLLTDVFDFYSDHTFLKRLFTSEELNENRLIAFNCVRKMMAPVMESRNFDEKMRELCKVEECGRFVVVGHSKFRGSSNCIFHHHQSYQQMVKHPSVDHFLFGDGESYWPFQMEVKQHVERFIRKLYVTLRRYRINCTPGVRPVFAAEVWKKYIRAGASHHVDTKFNKSQLEMIETKLGSKDSELFHELESALYSRLDAFYKDEFLGSQAYKEYLAVYKLPSFFASELKELQKEEKKKSRNNK